MARACTMKSPNHFRLHKETMASSQVNLELLLVFVCDNLHSAFLSYSDEMFRIESAVGYVADA